MANEHAQFSKCRPSVPRGRKRCSPVKPLSPRNDTTRARRFLVDAESLKTTLSQVKTQKCRCYECPDAGRCRRNTAKPHSAEKQSRSRGFKTPTDPAVDESSFTKAQLDIMRDFELLLGLNRTGDVIRILTGDLPEWYQRLGFDPDNFDTAKAWSMFHRHRKLAQSYFAAAALAEHAPDRLETSGLASLATDPKEASRKGSECLHRAIQDASCMLLTLFRLIPPQGLPLRSSASGRTPLSRQ